MAWLWASKSWSMVQTSCARERKWKLLRQKGASSVAKARPTVRHATNRSDAGVIAPASLRFVACLTVGRAFATELAPFWRSNFHFRSLAQLVCTIDHDLLAHSQAIFDCHCVRRGRPQRDRAQTHGFVCVVYDIDESALRATLNRCDRHQGSAATRFDAQACIDELVWEQRVVGIGEVGLELDRASRGIDLIVNCQQLARRQPGLAITIPYVDWQRLARQQARRHCSETVRGNGEHDRNRLRLGDNDQAGRVAGMYHVADVYLAQAEAAGKRRGNPREVELQPRAIHLCLICLHRALIL